MKGERRGRAEQAAGRGRCCDRGAVPCWAAPLPCVHGHACDPRLPSVFCSSLAAECRELAEDQLRECSQNVLPQRGSRRRRAADAADGPGRRGPRSGCGTGGEHADCTASWLLPVLARITARPTTCCPAGAPSGMFRGHPHRLSPAEVALHLPSLKPRMGHSPLSRPRPCRLLCSCGTQGCCSQTRRAPSGPWFIPTAAARTRCGATQPGSWSPARRCAQVCVCVCGGGGGGGTVERGSCGSSV